MSAFNTSFSSAARNSAYCSSIDSSEILPPSLSPTLGRKYDFNDIPWPSLTVDHPSLRHLAAINLNVASPDDLPEDRVALVRAAFHQFTLIELKLALALCGTEFNKIPSNKSEACELLALVILSRRVTGAVNPATAAACGSVAPVSPDAPTALM